MSGVHSPVEDSLVDSSDEDLLTWSYLVDLIPKDHHLFGPGDPSGSDLTWTLLDQNPLELAILSVLFVDPKRSSSLTASTRSKSDVLLIILVNRSLSVLTSDTHKVELFELLIDWVSFGDNSLNLNESVQVEASQVSDLLQERKVSDLNESLRADFVIAWTELTADVH